jgi:hypothetical protein
MLRMVMDAENVNLISHYNVRILESFKIRSRNCAQLTTLQFQVEFWFLAVFG